MTSWPLPLEFCARCGKSLGARSASLWWCSPGCLEGWSLAERPEWLGRAGGANLFGGAHPRTSAAVVREAFPWLDARVRS